MFVCGGCGNATATYNYEKVQFECPCGHVVPVTPTKQRCLCGAEYMEVTWWLPSGCSNCGRSFVE